MMVSSIVYHKIHDLSRVFGNFTVCVDEKKLRYRILKIKKIALPHNNKVILWGESP